MRAAAHLPVAALLVAVIVDGMLVPSAPSATLRNGHVVGPLDLVAHIADQVEIIPDEAIIARRGAVSCAARAVEGDDRAMYLLAPLARCLGARDVHWNPRSKTLELHFDGPVTIHTLPPYDPNAPRVAPTTVFTPEPAPPTPRVIDTGSPRPRRTAIPIVAPPASPPATNRRPRAP